jgi:hypothetical protein
MIKHFHPVSPPIRRRLWLTAVSVTVLLALAVPGAVAAKGSSAVTVCATGDDLHITVSWQGIQVDAVSFGWGAGQGGLGFMEPLNAKLKSGVMTHTFDGAASTAEVAGAGLHHMSSTVGGATISRPASGWSDCSPTATVPIGAKGSLTVAVCDASGHLRISATWQGVNTDGVGFGWGDGQGGLGILQPLGGNVKAGTLTHTFEQASASATTAAASLHTGTSLLAGATVHRPTAGWPAC